MKKIPAALLFALWVAVYAIAGQPMWQQATTQELKTMIPAHVEIRRDRWEIIARSRTGIIDRKGRFIASADINTAGYEMKNDIGIFFILQVPAKIGGVTLAPGEYMVGYEYVSEGTEEISFYEVADASHPIVKLKAERDRKRHKLVSLEIKPPGRRRGLIYFGRYAFEYRPAD